jgi:hypothetical protein
MLALPACIHAPIDTVPPSFETLRLLREQGVPPMALGVFTATTGAQDQAISIRGSTMRAPKGGNFGDFLRLTFESELTAAGKLDPAAPTSIAGVLTESRAGEDLAKGKATLGARVTVMRDGKVLLEKPYRVEAAWKSDFIGAIAIPEAFRQYNALYAQLVRQIFADPAFIAAVKQ